MNRIKSFLKFKIGSTKKQPNNTQTTINGIREMEEMLIKKQTHLELQISKQVEIAKSHGMKNKRAAMMALKRKKRFEQILQQVDGTLSTLEMQREALESAKNNVTVLQLMKNAALTLKSAQQHMDVDKVHDIMDDIAEQQDIAKEISDAISNPIGSGGLDLDEADLERELEELEQEELDKALLRISVSKSSNASKTNHELPDNHDATNADIEKKDKPPIVDKSHEDKELEDLALWASAL